ncbi:rCG50752 [Rattus norvegicus]|uniref:RCG50752 n=1 Tax=Rattus norvegicus TaxID=10116 RepID=A6KC27_RAT|nr:rCG50752 [Rattus norvegicus]
MSSYKQAKCALLCPTPTISATLFLDDRLLCLRIKFNLSFLCP